MSTILLVSVIVSTLFSLTCCVFLFAHREWRIDLQGFSRENRSSAFVTAKMLAVHADCNPAKIWFGPERRLWRHLLSSKHLQKGLTDQWNAMQRSRRWWEVGAVGSALLAACLSFQNDTWTIFLAYALMAWVASIGLRPNHFLHVEPIDVIAVELPEAEQEVCAEC